jgi:hypothetical protein
VAQLAEELQQRAEHVAGLERELAAVEEARNSHSTKAQHLADELRRRDARLAELDRARAEVEDIVHRREAQVVRFVQRVRERDQRLALQSDRRLTPAAPAHEHVLYAQVVDRYVLVERSGPPPAPSSLLELPDVSDRPLVIDRVGPSPLPGDPRRCAFAYAAVAEDGFEGSDDPSTDEVAA